jgi:ABC-type nitrate/sulfonate/bicarbonate transport system substrate-binding protein
VKPARTHPPGAPRRASRGVWGVLLLVLLCCLPGCRHRPAAPERLVIGLSPSLTSTLDVVAEQMGLFAEAGLQVRLQVTPSGRAAMDALFHGDVDAASSAAFPVVANGYLRNDFRILATLGAVKNDNKLVVPWAPEIRTVRDLRGRRVGVIQGTMAQYTLNLLLLEGGLTQGDVRTVFGDPETLIAQLGSGQLAAACLLGAHIDRARAACRNRVRLFGDESLIRITTYLTVRRDTALARPRAMEALLRAYVAAEAFVRAHPDQAFDLVTSRFGMDREAARKQWNPRLFHPALEQSMVTELEGLATWYRDTGLTSSPAVPDFGVFVHTAPLERVDPLRITLIR